MDELVKKIMELKKERNAVFLVHNYQRPEIQDIADYIGDSLGLSMNASKTNADVIVFCGVTFMAETASIICPDKTVLIPDKNAGCPLANMITVRELKELKAKHPDAVVVCYINTSAEIKAESDICCTSANSIKVVSSIPKDKEIIFIPDKSLGEYTAMKTGRKLIIHNGYCPTHHRILAQDIIELKKKYPKAKVVVHPECTQDVIEIADEVASTGGIWDFADKTDADTIIVGTENGMIYRLQQDFPNKKFISVSPLVDCPNMKLITLEKVLWALEDMVYEIKVEEDIRIRAKKAVDKMLEIGR